MADGTRYSKLSETVHNLHGETAALKDEQSRHGMLIEGVLQQLNNLASSYDSLVQITTKLSSGEGGLQIIQKQILILCLKEMVESKLDLFDWIFLVLKEEIPMNGS